MKKPILSSILINSKYIGNELILHRIKNITSATSISSSQLAILYRHHGIILQTPTSTSLPKTPLLNILIIVSWSAPNNLWESSKRNINIVFAVKPKLKTQTILPITQHDPGVIHQKGSTASTAGSQTTRPKTSVGLDLPNAAGAAGLVMKAPIATTNANKTKMIMINISRKNQELINLTQLLKMQKKLLSFKQINFSSHILFYHSFKIMT